MKVKVKIYNGVKYDLSTEWVAELEYNIKGFDVACEPAEVEEIENSGLLEENDEYHEYLILYPVNGGREIFRNSHIDLFLISRGN